MLHIVNKSPFEKSTLDSCLRVAQSGNALLLIEDGVYAALKGGATEPRVREALQKFKIYALSPDLEARGMKERVLEGVTLVDYGGFVDLVAQHNVVQSWL
jgi:tRNA 2-thiouridine synthesizing protein B